jgi:hypothetical protein
MLKRTSLKGNFAVKKNDEHIFPKIVFQEAIIRKKVALWLSSIKQSPEMSFSEIIKKIDSIEGDNLIMDNYAGYDLSYDFLDISSFNCISIDTGNAYNITLHYGSYDCGIDYWPQITVSNEKGSKTYLYHRFGEGVFMPLAEYTKNNLENGNIYLQKLYQNEYDVALTNGSDCVKININNKNSKNHQRLRPHHDSIKINNEEIVREMLLNLSFPICISELYQQFIQITGINVDEYASFCILAGKDSTHFLHPKDWVFDLIELSYGEISKRIMSKNGIKIEVNNDETWWEYTNNKEKITRYKDGLYSFQLHWVSKEEIDNYKINSHIIDHIDKKIVQINESTKQLVKLNKKNNV